MHRLDRLARVGRGAHGRRAGAPAAAQRESFDDCGRAGSQLNPGASPQLAEVRIAMPSDASFTYRSARSGTLSAGLALAVGVETLVVHLWLAPRHPAWAWTLTTLSLVALVCMAAEYRAWGRGAIRVTADAVEIAIPGRTAALVPRSAVAGAALATWRALPDGPDAAYVNAMAPAEPNVLVELNTPVPVRLAGGLVTRQIARLGLRVDDPAAFVRAVSVSPAG